MDGKPAYHVESTELTYVAQGAQRRANVTTLSRSPPSMARPRRASLGWAPVVPYRKNAPEQAAAGAGLSFRFPEPTDGKSMWELAEQAGLDVNSPYAYVMWAEYHRRTSLVAEDDAGLAGFVTGFAVPETDLTTVFVWQIAVANDRRQRGIGARLLDELVVRTGARCIEATVTPSNQASAALFRGLGARHGATPTEELAYGEHLFPGRHEAEIRFRIPVSAA